MKYSIALLVHDVATHSAHSLDADKTFSHPPHALLHVEHS